MWTDDCVRWVDYVVLEVLLQNEAFEFSRQLKTCTCMKIVFFDTASRIVTQPAIARQGFHQVKLRYSCWFKFFFTFSTLQLYSCLPVTSFKCFSLLYPTVRVLLPYSFVWSMWGLWGSNVLTAVVALTILFLLCLTPDDFTRQWGTSAVKELTTSKTI